MARQVGIVLGVAILVTVLGHPSTQLGSLTAFRNATVFTAIAAFLAGLSALLLIRARRSAGHPGRAVPVTAESTGELSASVE
jgi:hypothetical protein